MAVKQEKIMPPPQEVLRVTTLINKAIGRVLNSSYPARDKLTGEFEAPLEAWALLILLVRNVEAILTLAEDDLVLFPSAVVLARSAYESSVKIQWLLAPDDDFDREVRWLAQVKSEIEFLEKGEKLLKKWTTSDSRSLRFNRETLEHFHEQVSKLVPPGHKPMAKLPNIYDMLASLGEEKRYHLYVAACQYSHSTHFATGLYRQGIGIHKQFGEFITPSLWNLAFKTAWYALMSGSFAFVTRNKGNGRLLDDPQFNKTVMRAIEDLEDLK